MVFLCIHPPVCSFSLLLDLGPLASLESAQNSGGTKIRGLLLVASHCVVCRNSLHSPLRSPSVPRSGGGQGCSRWWDGKSFKTLGWPGLLGRLEGWSTPGKPWYSTKWVWWLLQAHLGMEIMEIRFFTFEKRGMSREKKRKEKLVSHQVSPSEKQVQNAFLSM